MNTQHVLIETLTPLHIGSGRLLQGNTEYLYFANERTVAVVDERKILGIIGEEQLDTWLGIINRGDDLLTYLNTRSPGVTSAKTSRRLLAVLGKRSPGGNQTVREQLFSGNGQPILPGSSLKGAIRTAVLNALIEEKPAAARDFRIFKKETKRENYKTGQMERVVKYIGGSLEKKYVGEDPNHDVFRLLRIGDAHFDQTVCLLSETLNQKGDGTFEMKESVKQFIECIPAGAETICRFQIPAELKARLAEVRYRETGDKMPHRDRMEWPTLLKDINDNTRRLIQKELDRYQTEHLPNEANEYVDSLKDMMGGLKPNQCVIRVGFGTGYLNMTGGWADRKWRNVPSLDFEKEIDDLATGVRRNSRYNSFALPKSRKMALGGIPLGFLKLTVFSESEWVDWQNSAVLRAEEKNRKDEAQRRANEEMTRLAAEAEAKRLEDERLTAEEARKPKIHPGPITKGMEVDAEVVISAKPNRVKIFVAGYDDKQFEMVDSAQQPKGYICRVALVIEKGKILRVRHLTRK